MKTKIGIPFGLALVMFIGVFTTMLALGALNPQRAEAAPASVSSVVRSNNTAGAVADWTITVTNNGVAIEDGDTFTIEFSGHVLGATCTAEQDLHAVCVEDQWEIEVAATDTAVAISVDVDSVATDDVTATIMVGTDIPASREFTIKFTSLKSGALMLGIMNPGVGENDITVAAATAFPVTTFAVGATIDDDPMPTVTRSDNRVGAYAMWTITATNDGSAITSSDTCSS